jgi:hypothetical protein
VTDDPVFKAALEYAEGGLHIFPALIIGKQKLSHISKDDPDGSGLNWGMTNDPALIRKYYQRYPRAGVGIPTGPINDRFVIETDTKAGGHSGNGAEAMAILVAANGPLPDTLRALSPSGSEHFHFRWPNDGGPPIKNSSNHILLPDGTLALGLDVKGDGGMVIAPPTRRRDGVYKWINWGARIARAPAWLIAAVRAANVSNGEPTSSAEPEADVEKIAAAVAVIPNPDDLNYEGWNRIGMAIWRATAGRGFAIFDSFSQKWCRYNAADTANTWAGYFKGPPTKIGAGTILFMANEASPDWLDRYHEKAEREMEAANRNDDYMMAEIVAALAAEGRSLEEAMAAAAPPAAAGTAAEANDTGAAAQTNTNTTEDAKTNGAGASADASAQPETAPTPEGGNIRQRLVAAVNERHALVLAGNKAAVMKFEADGKTFRLISIEALKAWYANKAITIGSGDDKKRVSPARLWFSNRERREYEGIEFAPAGGRKGYYNLWQGFAVEPRPGDCGKFLGHLRDNVARGDASIFNWVVGFFAQIVQQPAAKIGTALALRGPPGVGKTKVGEVVGSLFPDHYAIVSDPRYVTGQFNAHMKSLLLLHADEAMWAGDKRGEGRLKDLITGSVHFLEFKGVDPIAVRNYVRLLATGNPKWVVPAALRERRWAVLDVGEGHIQDIPYFAAIDNEMNNGGRAALLHHLLHFDLNTVDLRVIPQTTALLEQKFESATAEEKFWLDTLKSGRLPGALEGEPCACRKSEFYEAYVRHAGRTGVHHRSIQTKVGVFLVDHVPRLVTDQKVTYTYYTPQNDKVTMQAPAYKFPPLADCRKAFADKINQDVDWGNDVDKWQADELVAFDPAPDERSF